MTVQFDVFRSKLPEFHQFFSVHNAFLLAVVLAFTKVMHEFGHGLSCKHFGGECHEMGIMVLVLTPCLYCNVSDSWLLPNKWKRAAIGAAGMYVELMLASVCTFLWWFSQPGAVEQSLPQRDVHLVGHDGGLQRQSAAALRRLLHPLRHDRDSQPAAKGDHDLGRKMSEWCLGMELPEDPFLPQAQPDVLRRSTRSPRPSIAGSWRSRSACSSTNCSCRTTWSSSANRGG